VASPSTLVWLCAMAPINGVKNYPADVIGDALSFKIILL